MPFTDHTRRAKRRFIGILNAKRMKQRVPLYRDLLEVAANTVKRAKQVIEAMRVKYLPSTVDLPKSFCEDLRNTIALAERVLDQTRRRVLDGESLPAKEKIVSIFEPHTDIIIKDRRDTHYGHKVCLTAGASGLVLDFPGQDVA